MNADNQPFEFDTQINRREVPALKVHPMVLGAEGDKLFAASVADMDFKAPPCVLRALEERLHHSVFGYEAVNEKLLPGIVDWQQRRHGWTVEHSHILRAPNVLNALAIAASLFTGEGEGIIVQPPVFFDFYDVIKENRRKVVTNPLVFEDGRYEIDFDDLEEKAAVSDTRMIFLCNPHNPVGRVWSANELRRLGDICARHDVLVVSDEIHGDLVFDPYNFTPFAALGPAYADNSITCISPAKTFNIAACCSAFTIVPNKARREAFQVENSRLTVNKNNAFANVAMTAAYTEGEPWLDAVQTYVRSNLDLVRERLAPLSGVDLIEPEGTHQIWLDFRALGLTVDDLFAFLRQKAKWAASRGEKFGGEGAGFARVSIACPRAVLDKALDQLAAALLA